MASKDRNQAEVRLSVVELEADYIKGELMKLRSTAPWELAGAQPLIQRVPAILRAQKVEFEKHFEPSHVAFGPIHHEDPKLKQAEKLKLSLAAQFIKVGNASDELLFNNIKAEINVLKVCYDPDDVKGYDDEILAWMLFVDGCAVLYLTYVFYSKFSRDVKEEETWYWWNQMQDDLSICFIDLMLLENQLPFRVLKILMGSTTNAGLWDSCIKKFIIGMSKTIFGRQTGGDVDLSGDDNLLQVLQKHLTQIPVLKRIHENISYGRRFPQVQERHDAKSVMDLKGSGIHVKPCRYPIGNISFSSKIRGALKMPILMVNQWTPTMFMNLVASDTCCPGSPLLYISFKSYICFIASLIQTHQDVKELRVAGMLHNYLGSDEEVARLFQTMSRGWVPNPSTYFTVRDDINQYCSYTPIKLYSNYFGANWSLLAFLGATAGLVLTFLQTYYTIQKITNPPNKEP